MENTVTLFMTFKNALGNSCTISLDDPRDDIQEKEIIDLMKLIISKNVFQPKGYDMITPVSAKIVNAETTVFDLEI